MNRKVNFQKTMIIVSIVGVLFYADGFNQLSSAQEVDSQTVDEMDNERFQMKREGETVIRLDRQTGAMSTCQMKSTSLICRMAADERETLEKEIASLQSQLEKATSKGPQDETPELKSDSEPKSEKKDKTAKKDDEKFDRELDRMVDMSSKVLRRFFSVMKELKEDLARE